MNPDTIFVLSAVVTLWFGKKLFESYVNHILRDIIVKPSIDIFFGWVRGWKRPKHFSDNQVVKAFYVFQIIMFGLITLHLSEGTHPDWLTRLATLSCASATFVAVMFFSLVSANVRAK